MAAVSQTPNISPLFPPSSTTLEAEPEDLMKIFSSYLEQQQNILHAFSPPKKPEEDTLRPFVAADFTHTIDQLKRTILASLKRNLKENLLGEIARGRRTLEAAQQSIREKFQAAEGMEKVFRDDALNKLKELNVLYVAMLTHYFMIEQAKTCLEIEGKPELMTPMQQQRNLVADILGVATTILDNIKDTKRVEYEVAIGLGHISTKRDYIERSVENRNIKTSALAALARLEASYLEWQKQLNPSKPIVSDLTWQEKCLWLQQAYFCFLSPLQQVIVTPLGEKLDQLLIYIAQNAATYHKIAPSCFMVYAWEAQHFQYEQWVKPFLIMLYHHLEKASIQPKLDAIDKSLGKDLDVYNSAISSSSHVLLIGSRSLVEAKKTNLAVVEELTLIKRRRSDTSKRRVVPNDILPIVLSGTLEQLPAEFGAIAPKLWSQASYLQNLKDLIAALYDIGPGETWYNTLWGNFVAADSEAQSVAALWDEPKVQKLWQDSKVTLPIIKDDTATRTSLAMQDRFKIVTQASADEGTVGKAATVQVVGVGASSSSANHITVGDGSIVQVVSGISDATALALLTQAKHAESKEPSSGKK